ncbi:unnamed protein product [Linum tenue]|uniref:Uncharacterized protein n=1 Tax=Linum tenue TaxID=586396 RepID=A0AAV0RAN2_9ROSI|nr:unnamed protein product [Linum tenue]
MIYSHERGNMFIIKSGKEQVCHFLNPNSETS